MFVCVRSCVSFVCELLFKCVCWFIVVLLLLCCFPRVCVLCKGLFVVVVVCVCLFSLGGEFSVVFVVCMCLCVLCVCCSVCVGLF